MSIGEKPSPTEESHEQQPQPMGVEKLITQSHTLNGIGASPLSAAAIEELKNNIAHSTIGEEVSLYENNIHPTLEKLTETVNNIVAVLRQEFAASNDEEEKIGLEKNISFFEHRIQEIQVAIVRYCNSIARFETLRLLKMAHMEERDVVERFVQADHHRRQMHNALFTSLAVFSKKVVELVEDGYLSRGGIVFWDYERMRLAAQPDNDSPISLKNKEIEHPTLHTFHPSLLDPSEERNRRMIQEWAVAADLVKNIRMMREKMESKKPQENT